MDETPTTEVPVSTPDPIMPESKPPQPTSPQTGAKHSKSFNFQGLTIPLLIAFLLISGFLVNQITGLKNTIDDKNSALDKRLTVLEKPTKYVQEQVDQSKFQAVFLNGGQVYFGKISHIDQDTLTLTDTYKLKTGTFHEDESITGDNASLSPIGNNNVLNIERKNVIFWENLKDNGKVVQAIQQYEKANKK